MVNLYVVGSLNIDLVTKTDNLPKMGETIQGTGFEVFSGGKGANQAVAAARLGLNVHMIGCVGDDEFGDTMLKNLKTNEVSTKSIVVLPNTSSGIATIVVCNNDNFIILTGGANQKLTVTMIEQNIEYLKSSDIIILQNEIPFIVNEYVMKECHGKAKIIYNAAPALKFDKSLYQYIDILIINQHECEYMLNIQINNIDDAMEAVKMFGAMGIKNVIVTMGKDGAAYYDGCGFGCIDSIDVKTIDTTGAGDSFCAGVAVAVGEGKSLREAVIFANSVAALAIMKEGAQSSMPSYEEVIKFQEN